MVSRITTENAYTDGALDLEIPVLGSPTIRLTDRTALSGIGFLFRGIGEIATDPRLAVYMESVRSGLVFFVRPHRDLLAEVEQMRAERRGARMRAAVCMYTSF
mgnify:CR=1 FL=1